MLRYTCQVEEKEETGLSEVVKWGQEKRLQTQVRLNSDTKLQLDKFELLS